MNRPTNEEITKQLVAIISDGFNRSLNALIKAGAIDTTKLRGQYSGAGSKFYDLVTEQIELSAKSGTASIQQLFMRDCTTGPSV